VVVIVFRSRIRPGTEEGLVADGTRMYELASAMPGFVSYKDFAAQDGENVTIVEFDTSSTSPPGAITPSTSRYSKGGATSTSPSITSRCAPACGTTTLSANP